VRALDAFIINLKRSSNWVNADNENEPSSQVGSEIITCRVSLLIAALEELSASTAWITGHGVPSDAIGIDLNLYLDIETGNVYRKENGPWL
jgi:hypothetical protein